jgi:hypothetical protein
VVDSGEDAVELFFVGFQLCEPIIAARCPRHPSPFECSNRLTSELVAFVDEGGFMMLGLEFTEVNQRVLLEIPRCFAAVPIMLC